MKLFSSGVLVAIGAGNWPGKVSPKSPKPPRITVLPFFVGRPGETDARLPDDSVVSEQRLMQIGLNHLVIGDVRIVRQGIERRHQIGEAVHLAHRIGVVVRPQGQGDG